MKKRLFLLVTIIIAITHISNAQHFNYPFKMNDAEWKKFHSANERKAALQIPDSVLSIIPTSELINICLEYPYLFDIKLYNDAKRGYKALCDDFNGFAELQKREDIIDRLLDEYAMVPVRTKQISNKSDADKLNYGIACFVLRMALSNYVASNKMNDLQHNRLNSLIAQDKDAVNEISEAPVGLKDFPVEFVETDGLQAYSSNPSPSISYYTLSSNYNNTTRYTPLGSYVTAGVLASIDYNQGQKTSIANSILNSYDGVVIVDEATLSYNCHAYAWHVSEGGDRVWIGLVSESDEDVYWEDGSYIEVPESLATKVSYQGNHSAVRISSTEYISKWGSGPLIKHGPNNVPSGYNPYATKKYFKRAPLNFSISGPGALCGTTTYTLQGVPSGYLVSWSIDNADFSITSSGYQCNVSYVPANSSYSVANLKADISRNGYLVKSVTKHIVMHGNSLHIDGEQLDEVTPSGVLSGFTFTIPESDRSSFGSSLNLQSNDDIDMQSVRDSLKRIIIDSLIIHPIDPGVGPIGPAYPYPIDWDDDPEYGFTEINGEANILLMSDRFDGMNINFAGAHSPVSYSHLGRDVLFRMPAASSVVDENGEYCFRLRAFSQGGCHNFDLYFRVVPIEGEAYGDPEIGLGFSGNNVEVSFFGNSVVLPSGQVQIYPWYLSIYEVSTGNQVHASTNTSNYKTVNTSGWNPGIYLVRIICRGVIYTKKFAISQ